MDRGSISVEHEPDVLVLGGGMAGWATARLLAGSGWSVEVIDDPQAETGGLGESLEFSAPPLLRALGVDTGRLLADDRAYAKGNVFVEQLGSDEFEIWPPGWFRHPPLFGSHFTMHIDRPDVDRRLRQLALDDGALLTADRVAAIDHHGQGPRAVVRSVTLRSGIVRRARWYVDASGHRSRLLGRSLDLPIRPLGDERVALHRRYEVAPWQDVTRLLFSANGDERMTWAWVLPIDSGQVSVGVVVPAAELRAARADGWSNDDVHHQFLAAFPGVRSRLDGATAEGALGVRAFTPYVHGWTTGANWALVGDAAALLDPITSSGVTTSLNSAFATQRLIDVDLRRVTESRAGAEAGARANGRGGLSDRGGGDPLAPQRQAHHHLLVRSAGVVNQLIDGVVHRPGLRALIGTRLAIFVYGITNVLINAWYTRLRPINRRRQAVHGSLLLTALGLSRAAMALAGIRRLARRVTGRRRRRPDGSVPPRWERAADRPTPSRSG